LSRLCCSFWFSSGFTSTYDFINFDLSETLTMTVQFSVTFLIFFTPLFLIYLFFLFFFLSFLSFLLFFFSF